MVAPPPHSLIKVKEWYALFGFSDGLGVDEGEAYNSLIALRLGFTSYFSHAKYIKIGGCE